MLKHNTIQYFYFIPHHFLMELFYGRNSGGGVGENVRRGMKYNVPDLSWADEQSKC